MFRLLQIELKKIIPYKTFWILLGLVFLAIPSAFYVVGQLRIDGLPIDMSDIYRFPGVWNKLTYLASWFNLLIGMLVVILVCNEFSYKTFRQHVIDGQSKSEFVIGKISLIGLLALVSTLYLFIVGLLFGVIADSGDVSMFEEIKYLGIYFVQALGYMSVGMIIAIFIRSTALSIVIFLFSILIESIIQVFLPNMVAQYFPMEIIANLTPNPIVQAIMENQRMMMEAAQQANAQVQMNPSIQEQGLALSTTVAVAGVYIILFWTISYLVLTKKDIK